jgi:outer membrane protein assembly factor BamB
MVEDEKRRLEGDHPRAWILDSRHLGGRVYVLTAVPTNGVPPPLPSGVEERERGNAPSSSAEQEFRVLALDRAQGSVIWERTARVDVPHEGKQSNNTFASASAITDGTNLLAYFGSWGLYCYDLDGNLKWERDLGNMTTRNGFGEGASPARHVRTVVVNWDHEGSSFLVALDVRTGEVRWRRERDEVST